jgi:hypothetical protein
VQFPARRDDVIDTAKFKKEHPELAEAYTKTQNCKAQLRIKLKGE